MERQPVQSSNIVAVGYNANTAELEIEFKGGGIYRYTQFPDDEYESLLTCESLGRFFAQRIKGQYECRRVVMLAALVAGEPIHGEAS